MSITHLDDPSAVKRLQGARILVTGAHGFLGRPLARSLGDLGAHVFAPTRAQVDFTNQSQVAKYLKDVRPDLIIHAAAACGGIGANIANPGFFLQANALMGLILLEEARRHEVSKFVLISTTCAYPQNAPMPLCEDTLWNGPPTGATGPYGMAKRLLHEALAAYSVQYGLNGVVLLPANLYGPMDHFEPDNSHVVAAMIRRYVDAKLKGLKTITHWGTGHPTREFLYIDDAVRGIILAAGCHDDVRPVNLGTGQETSIRELADLIAERTGFRGETLWDTDKPDGQPRRVLDVSRAKAFGFNAKISLSEGLRRTVDWYESTQI